ncbi:MAG: argininosuccinate synthase, partial [Woeseiaceae bacterium]|nr:argininosuccinate synthase [Woeseiaceae bacterium]
MSTSNSPIVIAYSGGLDTSFCIPWLKNNLKKEVITVTIDTGGIDKKDAGLLENRALKLGAIEHHLIDAKDEFFDRVIKYLIAGNIRKGHLYPICVGAERGLQAEKLAAFARDNNLDTVAHGCTAAGNDQVRFDVALRTINPKLTILAPIRDNNWSREEQQLFLNDYSDVLASKNSDYSHNRGLWGITVGGNETLTSLSSIPEEVWPLSAHAHTTNLPPTNYVIRFKNGVPVSLNGTHYSPVKLIEKLEEIGSSYAIGRGIHLGDTIIGTKGRVAFEAPAASILIKTHRELEKLVLTAQQIK